MGFDRIERDLKWSFSMGSLLPWIHTFYPCVVLRGGESGDARTLPDNHPTQLLQKI
jgi:hypothetical protein